MDVEVDVGVVFEVLRCLSITPTLKYPTPLPLLISQYVFPISGQLNHPKAALLFFPIQHLSHFTHHFISSQYNYLILPISYPALPNAIIT